MSPRRMAAALLVAAAWASVAVGSAQTAGSPIRMSAWAVNMSNVGVGARSSTILDIRVTRWSTETERKQLITTFLEKGQDGLLRALQKVPVKGRIRVPGKFGPDPHMIGLGWDLRYAWQVAGEDGGRRILLATDRYVTALEQRNQPRTIDYPFTFIEIRLTPDGKGEGKLAVATRLSFDRKKNVIEMENYASEPVRLQNVTVEKES